MDIKSVLIEIEDTTSSNVLSSSAVLIENKYIITTSNILSNYFCKNPTLLEEVEAGRLHIYTGKNNFKLRVIWKNENEPHFVSRGADIFGLFKCKNIEQFCKYEFKDWSIDFKENNCNNKNSVSLFLILTIQNETVSEEEFKFVLRTWLLNVHLITLNKGDRLVCRSTPFGTRDFLNSLSEGIVSNILSESRLLLSDCSSTPGCEGGLVFAKHKTTLPIGIIISSLNWWRKEWAGFTLIANVQPIICQIIGMELVCNNQIKEDVLNKVSVTSENSLAQINCGADWGTCILLSKERGIFLTNSHVVRDELNIRIFWKNEVIPALLIYKNPDDEIFDLAIVKCDKKYVPSMSSCDITRTSYNCGDAVYCAGYPLLSTLSKPKGVTITRGIISDCNPYMIKTTCCVFPGFSGGAVLNSEGILLGIIVCNTRLTDVDVTYPKFNMAVPYSAVSDVISEYVIENGGSHVLKKLRSSTSEAIRIWMRLEGKL